MKDPGDSTDSRDFDWILDWVQRAELYGRILDWVHLADSFGTIQEDKLASSRLLQTGRCSQQAVDCLRRPSPSVEP